MEGARSRECAIRELSHVRPAEPYADAHVLQLCSEDDDFTSGIARFERSRRIYTPSSPTSSLSSPSVTTLRPTSLSDSPAASVLSLSPTLTDTASVTSTLIDDGRSISGVSTFSTYSTTGPSRRFTSATLQMLPRAVEIQDLVVLSFLFMEKNRRTRDQGSLSNERVMYANIAPMGGC